MWLEEWRLNREQCRQHGGPLSECVRPRAWYPQRMICHASQALAYANWRYDQIHEDAPYHDGTFTHFSHKRSEHFPFHVRDGVTIWVSAEDLTPDDNFLGDEAVPQTWRPPSTSTPAP